MKKIFITILFAICFLPTVSFAADMSLSASKKTFTINEDFLVQVMLDTKDAKVNAVEGIVKFPSEFLEIKEIRDGNSSINFWVEKPHGTKSGEISFSGITTGGFSGPKRFLFGVVFHSKKVGVGAIALNNIQVLQNDGLGTKVPTTVASLNFSISKGGDGSVPEDLGIKDTNPPEDFNPFIATDPTIFDGKYFLVFSTVDKGGGVDHYEVRESPWFLLGLWGGKYVPATSPYLLEDQTLKDKIYVVAIDKAGNTKVVKLAPQNKLMYFTGVLILGILLLICAYIYRRTWLRSTR